MIMIMKIKIMIITVMTKIKANNNLTIANKKINPISKTQTKNKQTKPTPKALKQPTPNSKKI
jgi:hypothetical protein